MNRKIKVILILVFAIISFININSILYSQYKQGESLDRIVAIVGNDIIMLSDIQGHLAMLSQQDPNLDVNDSKIYKKVLDALINEKLVVAKAIEDSVVVSDDEINQRWDYQLQRFVQYYGSEKRIEDIYGMSIAKIKAEYKDEIKKQLLAEKIRAEKFGEIKVTPREVEEFFQNYKDSLPMIPSSIEIFHIVKYVEVDKKSKEDVYELANRVRDSIINGGDFTDFAKRYSADKGSASSGGDLGWFSKGKLFREFEQAAFSIRVGEISKPVETPFGFHLIETLNRNKDSVMTRHILFKFGQSDEDKESAKKFLLEIKNRVTNGESFLELARKYSEEKETQSFGGLLGKFPLNQIPASLKEIADKLKIGECSDPIIYTTNPKTAFHIIYKDNFRGEHTASLKDDYPELEKLAIAYKQNNLYMEWIENLKKTMYWEIKD